MYCWFAWLTSTVSIETSINKYQFYIQFANIVHTAGSDMGLYEAAYGRERERYYESVDFHRQVVDSIAAGDAPQAEAVMCRHIRAIRTHTRQEETDQAPE